ncbi:uncharacterized protein KNAG_0H00980 [Huiozyma naganishii CBS 8797]|uniref:Uncharacterized protein n=1 Tax=Huiozyma naganishii (strain ATCC MYA-139 / BCRC 22969 / CBS 8797 / KCTC 17520 / NBRC 10181 / NCYC 3082 / Yp74L-3) TaxID=1071383 RepID=J7RPB5_HUIN7|nr:hypothetical protein KNAG_0H00980 [Kazachstania naganishii CBS 8797]CCK71513.1 hypothetical protein KNAG_0H00980 [Kazachstania naganishii CBS 8797]
MLSARHSCPPNSARGQKISCSRGPKHDSTQSEMDGLPCSLFPPIIKEQFLPASELYIPLLPDPFR